ncbi:centromere protein P-like [Poecilia latipinna]|uniref:centromere protein P-like n=1 Tax=Poecilia latipinna TaxID=48699 RepID=UPI00072E21A6|nr:PREDICTED: centromere protein P-like [Poecilia latipinna]
MLCHDSDSRETDDGDGGTGGGAKDRQTRSQRYRQVEAELLSSSSRPRRSERCVSPCDDTLREKFPSIVSLPEGCGSEVMTLNHPELPGCCFFIYWCVDVSTGGAVTPKIQLLSKIPEKALQLFPSHPAGGGAAGAFQSLLRILGTEAAIESIIRAVSLSESDELSN